MGNALPPHIYDTKLTADRKWKSGSFENRVFQQNRPKADIGTNRKIEILLPGYHWYYSVLISITLSISNDSAPIVKVHPKTGLVCRID